MQILRSWVAIPDNSDFTLHNLPYGIFCTANLAPRAGIAIGESILDLSRAASLGFFGNDFVMLGVFDNETLNDFIALGKDTWRAIRNRVQEMLTEGFGEAELVRQCLVPMSEASMLMPVYVRDYTDFYSSIEHATNVGKMFRPDNPLMPNWKHLPVGYHGRASSIVVSGTDFPRPKGQFKLPDQENPIFGASRKMDFELEVGFIVGKSTEMGETVPTERAEDYIFGFVLFNDWSARDIQSWEYQPLGPFLGKNFCSSVSPWVVTLDALEPFRVATPKQDPEVLPYLQYDGLRNFDIQLEVAIAPENSAETQICRSNYKFMYWNPAQQVAHHTINGCNIAIGDIMASGTISGQEPDSLGSLLELTANGKNALTLANGVTRTFLQDNDTVIMRGYAAKDGIRVGFGEVVGKVLPAL